MATAAAATSGSPEMLALAARSNSTTNGGPDAAPIPQLLTPSPKIDTPSPLKQRQRASDEVLAAARTADDGPRLKPRDVDPRTVCGIAPQLLAADPSCEDTLVTYGMLVALRAQGYQRAAVWYHAACRVLRVPRPNRAFIAACDRSDHLTIAIENEAAGRRGPSDASSPGHTPFPPADGAAAGSRSESPSMSDGDEETGSTADGSPRATSAAAAGDGSPEGAAPSPPPAAPASGNDRAPS